MQILVLIMMAMLQLSVVTSFVAPGLRSRGVTRASSPYSERVLPLGSKNGHEGVDEPMSVPSMHLEDISIVNGAFSSVKDIVAKAAAGKGNNAMSPNKEGLSFTTKLNGSDVRVGIIMARWNADIIEGLYEGVNRSLADAGVKKSNTFTTFVPGAYELPVTAKLLAASKRVDVIICLGCLIKGDTMHFEYIASAVSQGLMKVSVETMVPCLFGVLTTLDKEQAIKRSSGDGNEGVHWGTSAVEMGLNRMAAMGVGGHSIKADSETKRPFWNLDNANAGVEKKKNEEKKDGKGDKKDGGEGEGDGNGDGDGDNKKPRKIGF